MAGLACIKRSGEQFLYEEQGKLRLASGQQFAFSRSYYLAPEGRYHLAKNVREPKKATPLDIKPTA